MTVYIDSDYRCYTEEAEGRISIETAFFDGKCKGFIEGYRFVPEGETWIREDGKEFAGEMIAPWRNSETLLEIQKAYEEGLDMRQALEVLEVEP